MPGAAHTLRGDHAGAPGRKVLIVRVGALGDVLHALPAVAALHAARPDWQIDWVVDPRWSPLLVDDAGLSPVVRRIHLADTKLWSRSPFSLATLRSIRTLRRQLRAEHYDIALDLQGTLRSAVIARLSGAPVRVGYTDPREAQAAWFYTRRFPRKATHVVSQGAELLSQVFDLPLTLPNRSTPGAPPVAASSPGVGSATDVNPIPLPHEAWADDWATTEAGAAQLALLAPGAGWAAKQWPAAHFGELARGLQAAGFDVAVTAARGDNETALRVLAASDGTARLAVCNVAGLLALTRRAALVVGGDSGPTHLAAALGTPLVALFGPTDPARNGPWGSGPMRILRDPASTTSYKHKDAEDPGLARIPVEQVLQAALEVSTPPALSTQN